MTHDVSHIPSRHKDILDLSHNLFSFPSSVLSPILYKHWFATYRSEFEEITENLNRADLFKVPFFHIRNPFGVGSERSSRKLRYIHKNFLWCHVMFRSNFFILSHPLYLHNMYKKKRRFLYILPNHEDSLIIMFPIQKEGRKKVSFESEIKKWRWVAGVSAE